MKIFKKIKKFILKRAKKINLVITVYSLLIGSILLLSTFDVENYNIGCDNNGNSNNGAYNNGKHNLGDYNIGKYNSGSYNVGNNNTGNCNLGNNNTGNYNSSNNNNGHFNTKALETINVFNKPCLKKDWDNIEKPKFFEYFNLFKWIELKFMTKDEIKANPDAITTGGFLRKYTYKEAWANAFKQSTDADLELLKKLPNWNPKVFKDITGIEIK